MGVTPTTGAAVAAAMAAAMVATAWFPPTADALSQRARPPAVPTVTMVWAQVCRHPWVSLAVAMVPAAVLFRFGRSPVDGAVVVTVLGCGVLAAMVDVRCHRLPDAITAPLWAVAWPVMVAIAVVGGDTVRIRFALVAGLVCLVLLGAGWLAGMGLGDVKLGAMLALVVGWCAPDTVAAIGAALAMVLVATGAAVTEAAGRSVWRWLGQWQSHHRLEPGESVRRWFAFGPHLVAAATVVVVVGGPVSGA
jgi:prepilin signal peptidase PulO-like enzyme (type II secretory pathway)